MYIMRKNGRKFKSTPFLNLMITLNSFAFRVETVRAVRVVKSILKIKNVNYVYVYVCFIYSQIRKL